jgi:hypothetical protein
LGEWLGYDGMRIFDFQLLTNLLFQSAAAAALCQSDQFSQTKISHLVLFVCLFERKFFFVLENLVARVLNCTTVES